ncbi:MAG: iron uptake porin [Coleofasciculaceae cyanobacterium]
MVSQILWRAGLLSPAILGVMLVASTRVLAVEALTAQPQAVDTSVPTQDKQEPLAVVAPEQTSVSEVSLPTPESTAQSTITKISQLNQDSFNNSDATESDILKQINSYSNEDNNNALDQVTNVSQLRDVSPGDWAFEALRSLVERYGCIAGYPDGTFRGNRALSRFEFAAGLNACLNQVERLIASSTADFVRKQDLEALQRLVAEFRTELTTLGARVDKLEGRTAALESRQFSTTTKLNGEVVVGIAGILSGDTVNGNQVNKNTIIGNRVRLDLDTSFTGKDLLRTRLQATNLNAFSSNASFTPEGDFRFAGGTFDNGNDNSVAIDALLYQFPLGEKTTVTLEANAGASDDFANTVNPYFDGDGGSGALSQFGTRNAIYYLLNGSGIAINHQFNDKVELSLGYLSNDPANPGLGGGLFNSAYGAIAQVTIKPIEPLTVGLTYIHAYNSDFTSNGSTGSNRANLRSALLNNANLPGALQPFEGLSLPTSSNAYGVSASFQLSPKFVINGSAGYTANRTLASLVGTNGTILERGDYSTWNFAVGLALPDLGKEGNVAGIIFGMEPKVTGMSRGLRNAIGKDSDTSFHIEAFYQYKLTENIAITPGVIWLTAPDHNSSNDDLVIGTIRTTFTF